MGQPSCRRMARSSVETIPVQDAERLNSHDAAAFVEDHAEQGVQISRPGPRLRMEISSLRGRHWIAG